MNRTLSNRSERGSALLASLMVMVGLSLLGLAFVTISETEGAISVNQKNLTQVQQVAETGTKFVIDWFQNPRWALQHGLMPANSDAIKPTRTINGSTDKYKPNLSDRIVDTPFKPARTDRFYGSEVAPDIVINGSTNQAFLNTLNAALFASPGETGRITDIRIYAPPMLASTLNADNYWEGGTRLGVATVQVTATKCRNDSTGTPCSSTDTADRIIAQKTTRAVLSEWPFPGPSGPVQTNADLSTNGNLQVHWGRITATGEMALARPYGGLPYHDAYNRVRYEYGYVDPAHGAGNDPWPTDPASTDFKMRYDWINELMTREIRDPWWEAWSRSDYLGDGNGGPFQPNKYDDPTKDLFTWGAQGTCNICRTIFQFQTQNLPSDQKDVLFPKIDYDFWKDIAISGDDQDTIFYLQHAGGANFRDRNGTVLSAYDWINVNSTAAGAPKTAGFYFFDTANGLNPQNGGPGILTPTLTMNSSTFGGGQMQGFIYLNMQKWDASGGGTGPPLGWYQMPGEPYRDIGYWKVNAAGTDWEDDGSGGKVIEGANSGDWTFQDVNGNGVFDPWFATRTIASAQTGGNINNVNFPVFWYPGCTIGTNCSEPHEPYMNLRYPTVATDSVYFSWDGTANRRSKRTNTGLPTGSPVTCNVGSSNDDCTSDYYDEDGAIVQLDPILNGVLYLEGIFEQTGNIHYFGSVLVQGDASKAGTPDVWFDERLIKGDWPPPEFNFPRVYVAALQTD
ncbi:MAG: hypothetical protein ABR517_02335 [Thermoanaerobaculia bacterium]